MALNYYILIRKHVRGRGQASILRHLVHTGQVSHFDDDMVQAVEEAVVD